MKRYIWPIFVIVLLAAAHLFIFTGSIGIKYDSVRLKNDFKKSYQENRQLKCLVSKEESLDRIEGVAVLKLDMYYPEEVNYIVTTGEVR